MTYKSFGDFVNQRRLEQHLTLREFANLLGVSAPFWTDVEKGRRNPPSDMKKLDRITLILDLDQSEKETMLNLAGRDRSTVAPDLPEYIMERDYVSAALRTARDLNAGEAEWKKFVEELKKREG